MRRLLIRPGAIGDLIVSLPALEHLRAGYTEVWVAGPNVPLVRFADRVRSIASTSLDLLELGQAPEELCESLGSFDEIVSWYGTTREEFRQVVRKLPFRFLSALPPDASVHAVDFYLRQVGAPEGAAPRVEVPAVERRFVALHPFSGSVRKNWPLERFQELARRLGAEWCETHAGRRFENLYDLACWLAGARAFVGNDSGIAHLAAAVGTPVVALFGPTEPRVWAPRGSPVLVLRREPLEDLGVDEVEAAIWRICTGSIE